jgi:hypothetical protein
MTPTPYPLGLKTYILQFSGRAHTFINIVVILNSIQCGGGGRHHRHQRFPKSMPSCLEPSAIAEGLKFG